ncbi:uncharacterized protein [Triticum aestivum]|uniref:uncharacterized protein n=1 Tax=Triticum aestivum TaxID=4565 RepID=UPI001D02CA89|nr:uncharacterized protein LOC123120698 [Triticum aestivum]
MGLLALNLLMSMQRDRRRRPTQGRNGLVASSVAKRKDSACLHDDNSRTDKRSRYSGPPLPEDIWHYIHSLLPLRDAARVACVSHSFRSYWRRFPNLSLTRATLGLKSGVYGMSCKKAIDLARKTNHILGNHSGIGVTTLKLEICDFPLFNTSRDDLDRWLGIAVKPGIEELDLGFCSHAAMYNFPFSILPVGWDKSIRQLHLTNCAFRPTAGVDYLRSLTSLDFDYVHITEDQLSRLLSSTVHLEKLRLMACNELIALEIPSLLHRLSHMVVNNCGYLEVIRCKAPNLCSFEYMGVLPQLSLGDSL